MAETRIGVIGCAGRVGRMLIADIARTAGCVLAAASPFARARPSGLPHASVRQGQHIHVRRCAAHSAGIRRTPDEAFVTEDPFVMTLI